LTVMERSGIFGIVYRKWAGKSTEWRGPVSPEVRRLGFVDFQTPFGYILHSRIGRNDTALI
jgi:hypothetical protein